MADLIQLEQKRLAHDLQSAHFFCILLLRQEDLPIASLTDLCEDLKVALPQPSASLAQIGALAAEILCQSVVVLGLGGFGWFGTARLELVQAILALVDICKEIEVVVQEV